MQSYGKILPSSILTREGKPEGHNTGFKGNKGPVLSLIAYHTNPFFILSASFRYEYHYKVGN